MKLKTSTISFSVSDVLALLGFGYAFLQVFQDDAPDSLKIAIVICFTIMVTLTFVWAYIKIRANRKNYFSVMHARRGSEGDTFIKHIRSAQKQIRAIHTVSTPPSPLYTQSLLECLDRDVEIIRILPEGILKEKAIWDWLEQFNRHPHYRCHTIKGDAFRMPFSFLIIDDLHVFAYFPDSAQTDSRTEVLHFENTEVATLFRNVFQNLHIQACLNQNQTA